MLKPYKDRYDSIRALIESVLGFTITNGALIQQLRAETRQSLKSKLAGAAAIATSEASNDACKLKTAVPLSWKIDSSAPATFLFNGYEAAYAPSKLGNYTRLLYDRSKPFTRDIPYFKHCIPDAVLEACHIPVAYVVPQQYTDNIVKRLQWNRVRLHRLNQDYYHDGDSNRPQCYKIANVETRSAYEGHPYHSVVEVSTTAVDNNTPNLIARAGDWIVILAEQTDPRYALETLEPTAVDSFFRWGFFNAHLEKKEDFSDYVFEDDAAVMLETEPGLKDKFETWKAANPDKCSSQDDVLRFIFLNGRKYREPEYKRYPVFKLFDLNPLKYD
jgi:hypothetical protein